MRERGFSLIELSVVIVVISIMLAGLVFSLQQWQVNNKISQTKSELEQIRIALIAFAIRNGRLPCPDTNGDGKENNPPPNYNCQHPTGIVARPSLAEQRKIKSGKLPYKDIYAPPSDPYGNAYLYTVSIHYADIPALSGDIDPTPFPEVAASVGSTLTGACDPAIGSAPPLKPSFSACSKGGVRVLFNAAEQASLIYDDLPFIVLSKGANGHLPVAELNNNEAENLDGDRTFILRPVANKQTGEFYFDDLLIWESSPTLAYYLIQAGVLP